MKETLRGIERNCIFHMIKSPKSLPNQFVRLHFLKAADCFGDKPIARAAKNVLNPIFGDDVA
jgi:hypothetical protein